MSALIRSSRAKIAVTGIASRSASTVMANLPPLPTTEVSFDRLIVNPNIPSSVISLSVSRKMLLARSLFQPIVFGVLKLNAQLRISELGTEKECHLI